MNSGFRFKNWPIYKETRIFRKDIYDLIKILPREEVYALSDQMRRAVNSIILNIAESASKNTDKDMRLYINRAQCSLDEIVSCLDCAVDSQYLNLEEYSVYTKKAENLAKQFNGFISHLTKTA